MKLTASMLIGVLLCGGAAFGADATAPGIGQILDRQLTQLEHEFVPLAEAMPAAKYNFAPTGGEFTGVRTYGQQVTHVAAVLYLLSSTVLEEKNPTEMGHGENGPASLKTKAEDLKYLKDAFAYAHNAMHNVTNENYRDMVKSAFGSGKTPRVSMATLAISHSFDHYGQMVVYLRMNGMIPPASRRR